MPKSIEDLGMGTKVELDFAQDKYLVGWLGNRPTETVRGYKVAMKRYVEYTGMNPLEML